MRKTILILWLSILSIGAFAQISVTATLDSVAILIGDQVNLTLNIAHDASIELGGIDVSALDTLKEIEVLKINPPATISQSEAQHIVEQKILLTSFTEGRFTLPSIRIPYKKGGEERTLFTKQMLLKVNTLDVSDATELQNIKGIIDEPLNFRDALPYLILIGGLALIAFGTWYFIKRSRKKEIFAEFEKKRLPSHVIALTKLENLNKLQLWQSGEIKSFQSQLTFILREYLEGRFKVPALESTTDEIIDSIKKTQIQEGVTENLKNILQTADLVKFAKSEPSIEVHQQAFENITSFVNQTKPQVEAETKETDTND